VDQVDQLDQLDQENEFYFLIELGQACVQKPGFSVPLKPGMSLIALDKLAPHDEENPIPEPLSPAPRRLVPFSESPHQVFKQPGPGETLPPTAHCLLFTVYCLLFTVYCLLLTGTRAAT
jgi:hypothetical protein